MRTSLIATALLAAAGVVYGCGSDTEDSPSDTSSTGTNIPDGGTGSTSTGSGAALKVAFSPMYSAFDGVHEFKLPVIVDEEGGAAAKFEASDPSYVDIDKTAEGAMLTMRKSGEVTITATLGDRKGTAKLSIAKASPGDYDLGKMRYNNGLNAFANIDRDAGAPSPDAGFMVDAKSACTSCHGEGEKSLDVEHTPQQTGGYTDQELVQIFTEGRKPEGVMFRTIPTPMGQERWKTTHKWDMTTDEARGIVVYLRGMTPKAQGEVDFAAPLRDPNGNITINQPDGGVIMFSAPSSCPTGFTCSKPALSPSYVCTEDGQDRPKSCMTTADCAPLTGATCLMVSQGGFCVQQCPAPKP
jgi:cytochrome c553